MRCWFINRQMPSTSRLRKTGSKKRGRLLRRATCLYENSDLMPDTPEKSVQLSPHGFIKISEFLDADQEVWEERFHEQWKEHEPASIQQVIQPFIDDPKWAQLAQDALQQDYDIIAFEITRFYQIEVTTNLFKLLEKYPTNGELYMAIMDTNHRHHILDLCTFAETHLSLSNLSNDEQDCLQ